jgi:selenocysteine-specific elongation factor
MAMEKHITVCVAGHVDHGKTSLVRCLTGTDTDRLKEEKLRGLTIEPGIALLGLPSGRMVALVDVPGHSDYLKNTIRGLSSVDMAILVVAADDGVMPQTLDHLEVLNFIKAKSGIVVLSKADLVDDETLELAELEIREVLAGTFLEGKPVIPFSAVDQRGAGEVLTAIEAVAQDVSGKAMDAPFRLWIDQVRSFAGFGTVASGTILTGTLSRDDPIQLLPSGKETKARFLEVHHQRVDKAMTGQRVGINLHKIPMDDVNVGMVLAAPGTIQPSTILNAELSVLPKARKAIVDRQRVRLYAGTCGTNALVVLMERQRLNPGESGLVQLRLLEPLSLLPQDPFVVSLLNLHSVVGGGTILEVAKEKYRVVKTRKIVPYLQPLQRGDVKSVTALFFLRFPNRPLSASEIARSTGFPLDSVEAEITSKIRSGELFRLVERGFFLRARYDALKKQLADVAKMILSRDAFKMAATPEELKYQLEPSLDDAPFERMLADLCKEGKLAKTEAGYRVPDLVVGLSSEREKLAARLLEYARELDHVTFGAGTFCKLHGKTFNLREIQKLLDYLHARKQLVRLNDGRFLTCEAMEEIKKKVREKILQEGSLTLQGSKEVLGYGRTRGVAVLEYMDAIGLTIRVGDERFLRADHSSRFCPPCEPSDETGSDGAHYEALGRCS